MTYGGGSGSDGRDGKDGFYESRGRGSGADISLYTFTNWSHDSYYYGGGGGGLSEDGAVPQDSQYQGKGYGGGGNGHGSYGDGLILLGSQLMQRSGHTEFSLFLLHYSFLNCQ